MRRGAATRGHCSANSECISKLQCLFREASTSAQGQDQAVLAWRILVGSRPGGAEPQRRLSAGTCGALGALESLSAKPKTGEPPAKSLDLRVFRKLRSQPRGQDEQAVGTRTILCSDFKRRGKKSPSSFCFHITWQNTVRFRPKSTINNLLFVTFGYRYEVRREERRSGF